MANAIPRLPGRLDMKLQAALDLSPRHYARPMKLFVAGKIVCGRIKNLLVTAEALLEELYTGAQVHGKQPSSPRNVARTPAPVDKTLLINRIGQALGNAGEHVADISILVSFLAGLTDQAPLEGHPPAVDEGNSTFSHRLKRRLNSLEFRMKSIRDAVEAWERGRAAAPRVSPRKDAYPERVPALSTDVKTPGGFPSPSARAWASTETDHPAAGTPISSVHGQGEGGRVSATPGAAAATSTPPIVNTTPAGLNFHSIGSSPSPTRGSPASPAPSSAIASASEAASASLDRASADAVRAAVIADAVDRCRADEGRKGREAMRSALTAAAKEADIRVKLAVAEEKDEGETRMRKALEHEARRLKAVAAEDLKRVVKAAVREAEGRLLARLGEAQTKLKAEREGRVAMQAVALAESAKVKKEAEGAAAFASMTAIALDRTKAAEDELRASHEELKASREFAEGHARKAALANAELRAAYAKGEEMAADLAAADAAVDAALADAAATRQELRLSEVATGELRERLAAQQGMIQRLSEELALARG